MEKDHSFRVVFSFIGVDGLAATQINLLRYAFPFRSPRGPLQNFTAQ